jgi:hypothetical protein
MPAALTGCVHAVVVGGQGAKGFDDYCMLHLRIEARQAAEGKRERGNYSVRRPLYRLTTGSSTPPETGSYSAALIS